MEPPGNRNASGAASRSEAMESGVSSVESQMAVLTPNRVTSRVRTMPSKSTSTRTAESAAPTLVVVSIDTQSPKSFRSGGASE